MNISSATTSSPTQSQVRFTKPAPEQVAELSISPRQTEALLPTELRPAGEEDVKQEVSSSVTQDEARLEDIRQLAEKANEYLNYSDTHLKFKVSEQTGQIVINVIDSDTEEVVREIPPENLQRFASRISEMRGLLFEAKG